MRLPVRMVNAQSKRLLSPWTVQARRRGVRKDVLIGRSGRVRVGYTKEMPATVVHILNEGVIVDIPRSRLVDAGVVYLLKAPSCAHSEWYCARIFDASAMLMLTCEYGCWGRSS